MGDFIKEENNEYYVLAYGSPRLYITPSFIGKEDIALAQRHSSLSAAVAFAQPKAWISMSGFAFVKVRVTTTPATTERKVTSRTKIDATKPCVLFNDSRNAYGLVRPDFNGPNGIGDARNLNAATIFADLGDAIAALQRNSVELSSLKSPLDTTHIYNVETITTPGKTIVTPLA